MTKIQLTPEQHRELADNGADEIHAVDPVTNVEYVLVPEASYARWRQLLGDAIRPEDAYPAIDRSFADGWNDPRMDEYDRYEELKR